MKFVLFTFVLCLFTLICNVTCAADGLQIVTMFKPDECTQKTQAGDTISVHYTGRLTDGRIFDSSIEAKREPLQFEIGKGRVIPGWEQGLLGMCVGEKRQLTIPPELAYGKAGAGGVIPPDATLTFETELVAISRAPGVEEAEAVVAEQPKGWINTGDIGFLLIVVAFVSVVAWVLKAKPEITGREPRRVRKQK